MIHVMYVCTYDGPLQPLLIAISKNETFSYRSSYQFTSTISRCRYSGAGADADPAADTAAEAIRGAGQRFTGMGTDGESDTSQPRQRCDDTPPGVLQTARTGRGSGSRREADTRQGSVANGCEATTPAYT